MWDWQVVQERASGVLDQSFLENRFLNHYKNLTNVVMRIAPRQGKAAVRSLLLAAHFESTFGSPGEPLEAAARPYHLLGLSQYLIDGCWPS